MVSKKSVDERLFVRYEPAMTEGDLLNSDNCVLGGLWPSRSSNESLTAEHDFGVGLAVPCLGGAQHLKQWWTVDGGLVNVGWGELDGLVVAWRQSADFIFASVSVLDHALGAATFTAYRALLREVKSQGKPHLLRIWNFVPRLNEIDSGVERYQLFNDGRRRAFAESGYTLTTGAPAACVLGTRGGGLRVVMLAGVNPAVAIENPRQISSYHYPKRYGVDAPIFSRAAWLPQIHGADILFVSGTASIVGHETLHREDTLAQLQESVRNIEAVLHSANQRAGATRWSRQELQGRVFIRHAVDYPQVKAYLQDQGMTRFCYVQADICRSDLLVEIEAEGQAIPVCQ